MKRKLLTLLTFSALSVAAQEVTVLHGDCTPLPERSGAALSPAHAMQQRRLPSPRTQWDATKTYHQLVVLFTFSDKDFSMDNPREVYDSIFNGRGYNQGHGKGSVADYFREQSGGLLNLRFTVCGPVKISTVAQPYSSPTKDTHNYGSSQLAEAMKLTLNDNPGLDYSLFDWNDDGSIEQVIYVYAGYCGNQNSMKSYGHIWPNTSSFSTITTPDNHTISNYTCSAEKWANDKSCGIGTICHEFSHSLGLPDIYPTSSSAGYSVVDEWDLMDGGNFTNYGWCPPNYSPLEKMLLGWLTPTELTEPATIAGLKPVSQGGEVYQIKHTANEYLLVENRQWDGWDLGVPGKGLVVYHVNYVASKWRSNSVNNTKGKYNYHLINADNISIYEDWMDMLTARGVTTQDAVYQHSSRLNSWIFSSAPYPWTTDSTGVTVDSLTDHSLPATKMYNAGNTSGTSLGKPITDIRQNEDGTISFLFMGGAPLRGDMNGDRQLTMADVVEMATVIALGGTSEQRHAADVNDDGQVTVADIICLQKLIDGAAQPSADDEPTDYY